MTTISNVLNIPDLFFHVFKNDSYNGSLVLNYRTTSVGSCKQCEKFFLLPWNNLANLIQNSIPKSIFLSHLTSINNFNQKFSTSTCTKYIRLEQIIFKHHGLPLVLGTLSENELKEFDKSARDLALTPIWYRVRGSIDNINLCSSVPTSSSPSAEEIRKFLTDPNNEQAFMSVKMINLSGLGLKEVPPELSRLQGLTHLDLSNNQIAEVPDFNLPQLTVLSLHKNLITEVPDFSHLPELKELNLADNQIATVHDFNHLPKLTLLILSYNQIAEVPNFSHLPQLTDLYLYNNQIAEVPDFNHLPELTTLALSHNKITIVPDFSHLLKLNSISLGQSTFIPAALLLRFPKLISNLADQSGPLDYQCKSSLALLWQSILRKDSQEELALIFSSLTEADQNLIFHMVWEKAGKPMNGDLQWGEHHAFDDPILFTLAVKEAIFTKLARLSQDEKNKVYLYVCELGGGPQIPDIQWGENYAKTHLCCLADAISRVLKS